MCKSKEVNPARNPEWTVRDAPGPDGMRLPKRNNVPVLVRVLPDVFKDLGIPNRVVCNFYLNLLAVGDPYNGCYFECVDQESYPKSLLPEQVEAWLPIATREELERNNNNDDYRST